MERSNIEWTEYVWSPVTGCRHECPYCYAAKIASRFCSDIRYNKAIADFTEKDGIYELESEIVGRSGRTIAYPFGFAPTLHKNRLTKNCKPAKVVQSSTFFVCGMADLFGEWVPDEWIEQVFKVCADNPKHRYLFLTKNPERYIKLAEADKLPKSENMWYGTTINWRYDLYFADKEYKTFLSIEPIFEDFGKGAFRSIDWVIVGAETGKRRYKVVPEKSWVQEIVFACNQGNVPVFLKNNLADVWQEPLIQQYPWEVREKRTRKKGD